MEKGYDLIFFDNKRTLHIKSRKGNKKKLLLIFKIGTILSISKNNQYKISL